MTLPTTPLPSVRVAWRPEQFNRVTNGTFETNTTGWATTAGINAAGTSITRITTDFHSGTASASVVCSATDGSGVNFDMGSNRFYGEASYGAMYVAVVWLKRVSGSRRAKVILGSEGTSADRATLTITDLTDAWQPYTVRWLPSGNRTDVQLAVTNGSAEAVTFRIDDVSVYLLDGFTQVENGSFEVDTTGWSVGIGGFTAAATSITQTAGGFGGSYCGRVVTSAASATSGTTYSLAGRTFLSGRTYRLRVGAKTVSGSTTVALQWGSAASADSQTDTITLTSGFAWYTSDWEPSADRTDVELCIRNTTAASRTFDIDEVEVYEDYDDLERSNGNKDVGNLTWSRSLDSIGTASFTLHDTTSRYAPRDSTSGLYGSVTPGKRVWVRSVYNAVLYANFYGTITTIEPRPFDGVTDIVCEDVMGDLDRAEHASRFYADATYANARIRAIGSVLTDDPRNESTSLGLSRIASTTLALEGSTFYAGTDDLVGVLEYLRDLNEATQSVHWCEPSVHAMIGWRYTVQDRATLMDSTADFTVTESDPLTDIGGVRYTHEALENQQTVPWQGYEMGPLAPDHYPYWIDGLDILATGIERDTAISLGYGSDDENPYLHYTREVYGDNSDVPEPTYRIVRRRRKKDKRGKGRKFVTRRRRIYPDAFAPINLVAGDVRTFTVDFALPVAGLTVGQVSDPDTPNKRFIERSPQRIVVEYAAYSTTSLDGVFFSGTPYTPLPEAEVQQTLRSAGNAIFAGPTISTPYIPSRGSAEGVAAYRNWRYSDGRVRPTLEDHNVFPRTLTADLTDHITVTADRWELDAVPFVVTGVTWTVTEGGLDWTVRREVEELPTHTDWFTLDDATKGLDDAVVLAY